MFYGYTILSKLKGGPSDLGTKTLQKYKKIILVLPKPFIFIHETPVVENHLTTGEIRELLRRRSTPTGITVYFLHEHLAHLNTENTQMKVSNIASYEDIMENDYMFVML